MDRDEVGSTLVELVRVLLKLDKVEKQRKARLEEEPRGFHLFDGDYNCFICASLVTGEESWYDEYGIKCMRCQQAVWEKIIPGEIFRNDKIWYKLEELNTYYGVSSSTARRLVREGKLNARIIKNKAGHAWFYIFLVEENPKVLQLKPKVTFQKTGEATYRVEYPKLDWKLV